MRFELKTDHLLEDNLPQIYRKQIKAALRVVGGGLEPNDTRVHAIRKHLKRTRAVLDLVRKRTGRRCFRRQDRWLRDVGRSIRQIRDAEVRLFTLRHLEDEIHHHYLSYQKIERLLALESESFNAAFDGWEHNAMRLLNKARRAAKKWPVRHYRKKDFRKALRRGYRCGCKALIAVVADPSIPNLHNLRKHVKRLGYQVQLLRSLNPVGVARVGDELTGLGDLLGDLHDLSFLAERLCLERGERHWGIQDEQLLAMMNRKQRKLRTNGIEIAARFFRQTPREFALRTKRWLESGVRELDYRIAMVELTAG